MQAVFLRQVTLSCVLCMHTKSYEMEMSHQCPGLPNNVTCESPRHWWFRFGHSISMVTTLDMQNMAAFCISGTTLHYESRTVNEHMWYCGAVLMVLQAQEVYYHVVMVSYHFHMVVYFSVLHAAVCGYASALHAPHRVEHHLVEWMFACSPCLSLPFGGVVGRPYLGRCFVLLSIETPYK